MVQADTDAPTDNVARFPSATSEPQPRPGGRSKDRRAAARQAKKRSKIKADRDASAAKATPVYAPPIAPTVTQSDVEDATPLPRATAPQVAQRAGVPAGGRATTQATATLCQHTPGGDRLRLLAANRLRGVTTGRCRSEMHGDEAVMKAHGQFVGGIGLMVDRVLRVIDHLAQLQLDAVAGDPEVAFRRAVFSLAPYSIEHAAV